MYLPGCITSAALSVWRVLLRVLDHHVYKSFSPQRELPQKLGEGTKLLTSSAQGPPSQLNLHVLSPRSVLMFSVLAQSCLWLKLSGRMLLVRLEKIHQTDQFIKSKCQNCRDLQAFLRVKFSLKVFLRVKDLTFHNSASWI